MTKDPKTPPKAQTPSKKTGSRVVSGRVSLDGLRNKAVASNGAVKHIQLAIPSYGASCAMIFTESLFRLTRSAPRLNLRLSMQHIDYADIELVRNYLISNFYFNSTASHILFLDTDMGFEVEMIQKMIALDEHVVGTIYPRRSVDLQKLYASKAPSFDAALAEAAGFVGNTKLPDNSGDFIKVNQLGTGVMLISRECIDQMITKCPEIVQTTRFRTHPVFAGKFDKVITPFDKLRMQDRELSEDLSFCHRWVQGCGGSIHASITYPVRHQGQQVVTGRFRDVNG